MVARINQSGAEVSSTVGSEGRQDRTAPIESALRRVEGVASSLFTLAGAKDTKRQSAAAEAAATAEGQTISFVARELQTAAETGITGSAGALAEGITNAGEELDDLSPEEQDALKQASGLRGEVDRLLKSGKRDVAADSYYKRKVAQLITQAPGLKDEILKMASAFKPEADIIKSAQREQLDQYARDKGLQDAAYEQVKNTAVLLNIDVAGRTFDQLRTDPLLQSYMNSAQRVTATLQATKEITSRTDLSAAQKVERTNAALEGVVGEQLLLTVTAAQDAAAAAMRESDPAKRALIVQQAKGKMQTMLLQSVGTLDLPVLTANFAPAIAVLDNIEGMDDAQLAALTADNSSRQAALQRGLARDFPEAERAAVYVRSLGPLAGDATFQATMRQEGVMATLLNPLRRGSGLIEHPVAVFGQSDKQDDKFKNGAANAKKVLRMFSGDTKATPEQLAAQAAGIGEFVSQGLKRPKYDGFVAMLPELSNPQMSSRLSTPAFKQVLEDNRDQLSKFYTDLITKVDGNLREYSGRNPKYEVDAGGNVIITVDGGANRNGPSNFYARQVVRDPSIATLNQFIGLYINAEGGDRKERSAQVAQSLNGGR